MNNKKIWFIILGVFFIALIIFGIFLITKSQFLVHDFTATVTIPYNTPYSPNGGNVCYGNKFTCHKPEITTKGEINTSKIGEYKLTYTYTYKNHTLTKEQTIKVIDNIPPTIKLPEEDFIGCPNKLDVKFTATAYDEYDGDISDKIDQTIENNQVIFKVSDSSGNIATASKALSFLDNETPQITLNGARTIYVTLNGKYQELGATATDNCDGDISNKIITSGTVNSSVPGEYDITYKVTDNVGNTATATRKIFVYEKNNYNAPSGKSIYLTFDDGPGPYTSKLLDILKKYNVPATFFVTNQALTKNYDSVILRAYNEGHTIGLHTNTHNYSIYQNSETYFNDLYAIQDKVKRITGYTSTIIRFPGGSSNTISENYDGGAKIMSELTKAVEAKGFRYFDWNISSGDAGETTSTSQVVKNITSHLGNGSTYMVLQHDIKGFSVNAVEEVILYGLAKGYTFRAITMDTPTVHHRINN